MKRPSRTGDEFVAADAHVDEFVVKWKQAMDRRNFVRTAGGLLVLSGLGCGVTDGTPIGFIEVTVTGLTPGASSAGVVVATPQKGGQTETITIPPEGVERREVNSGTYAIVYTAPSGHVLAPGTIIPAFITVDPGETTPILLALTAVAQSGTLAITVTGLAAGASSGGSALITPSAGGAATTLDIGGTGLASAQFSTGQYTVAYTAPSGYTLTSGTTPQTVTITTNQTTTIQFGLTAVAQAVGTLQVNVTGISATAPNGGTVVATPSGGSPTTLTVPVSGQLSAPLAVGSYSVAYTPPLGHSIGSGTTPQNVSIAEGATVAIAFGLNTFVTPDILTNASFETDWNGFKDFGSADPKTVTRANDFAHTGSFSARFIWTPAAGDTGAEMAFAFQGKDRVWVRFWFRLTSQVSTIWKFCRNREPGFGDLVGGLFVEANTKIISWGFDAELSAQTVGIGLTQAQVLDGNWHSIEYDYWRNGDPSGFPTVGFWFDGQPVSGTGAPSPGSWQNGRLVAGQRSSNVRVGMIQMMGTLNGGNNTSGQCNIDDVAISGAGRIG